MKTIVNVLIVIAMLFPVTVLCQSQIAAGDNIAGKMYFTKNAKAFESERFDTTFASDQFSILDDIYIRAYFKKPLRKIYDEFNFVYDFEKQYNLYNYAIRIYADGQLKLQWLDELNPKDFQNKTSFQYTLSSSNEALKQAYSSIVNDWTDLVIQLKQGEHQIKFEMIPLNRDLGTEVLPVISQGVFTLKVDTSKFETFKKRKSTSLPESTLQIPGIEESLLEASTVMYDDAVPVKAIITDVNGDWTYSRDQFGNITGRQIIVSIVFAFPQRKMCLLKTAMFYQSHQGNGVYDNPIFVKLVPGYYDYEVNCNQMQE
ncbi:MAG: hypothetical protein KQI35_19045 [Bacteroidetes bacterium]|nr:hypothetical protein [Bacteroidota bacterium]